MAAQLIVFDLDGTLIDSRDDLANAANALIVEHGGRPLSTEAITGMVGHGVSRLVDRALDAARVATDRERALARFLTLYDERLLEQTRPYDGIVPALERLAPFATLAVLTNKPLGPSTQILDALNLSRFFAWTLGGDGPLPRKPDPAGLLQLIERAGASPATTVMVGDSEVDLATAHAAGTRACLAAYGFGYGAAAGHLAASDLIVDSPLELGERALST